MTLVTGTVQDLGYDGMEGTLWARPARFRSDGSVVYAPERKPFTITGGVVSAELAPGPAVLELQVGSHARGTFEVVIPDTDITLADLLDTVFPWEPAQVSQFVAERELAVQAKTAAETAAGQASTAAGTATTAAQQTGQDRTAVAADKQVVVGHVQALAAPNDAAVLGLISEGATTQTKAALNATYGSLEDLEEIAADTGPVSDVTPGKTLRAGQDGAARTVALTGHSLMYGMDNTSAGTTSAANGAGITRSVYPTTERFLVMANTYLSPGPVSIINQSYPGDRSAEALTRWAGGTSGDLEIVWIDANDGLSSGAGPALSDAETAENLRDFIRRARDRGADVVVVGGTPGQSDPDSRKMMAAADTDRVVAERMGARYVDVGEILTGLPRSQPMFSSGVHLSKEAYNLIGTRLAALMGPKGVTPPKVAVGRTITPRDRLHTLRSGAAVVTRSGAADGSVWQLPASGSTLALCVDVVQPCIPLIRARVGSAGQGYGVVGVYSNMGGSGISNRHVKLSESTPIASAAGGYVYFLASPLVSPGPDSIVLRREAGSIEIDQVQFLPLEAVQHFAGNSNGDQKRTKALDLAPVGGVSAGRTNASWAAMVDLASGVPLTTAAAATTKVDTRWLFDVTLGPNVSGVSLTASVYASPEPSPWLSAQAYWVLRSGADLIVRKFDDGGPVDTTVAGVFPATGMARAVVEVHYDAVADALKVYVDGVERATVTAPLWHHYMAGLIAGTAAGGGYAAGTGSVVQKASPIV